MALKRATATLAGLSALLLPALAAACPQCAGRSDGGIARSLVLGAFVMFPFVIVAAVLRVIRSGERDDPPPPRAGKRSAPVKALPEHFRPV